ncbi:stalk domain-containing protein [Paenibacillus methanolicus]|uniref:Copper amine oxidase-like protein n=1 Tax=Paenibacillus methanolicus TaxID=582686 RepID=A0A5S5BTU0_9BACL|nr:stalk domain-containing protein [Paenibacillus methanolicus]TYP69716.1 copper amine oxidase-like protein [Paenibacillus methanolicus]
MKDRIVSVLLASLTALQIVSPAAAAPVSGTIAQYGTGTIVKKDGTLWEWGRQGMLERSVPTQVTALKDIQASIGHFAVKKDDTVWHWAVDYRTGKSTAVQVPGMKGLTDVVPYGETVFAVDADGAVYRIPPGEGYYARNIAETVKLSDIDSIIAFSSYYESDPKLEDREQWLFLKKDGTVLRHTKGRSEFTPVTGLDGIVALEGRFALQNDGTVWALSDELSQSVQPPQQVKGLNDIKKLTAFTAIDGESRLWYWGSTATGFSDGTQYHAQAPVRIATINDVRDAYVVGRSLIVLTNNGKLYETSIETDKMSSNPSFSLLADHVDNLGDEGRHFQKTDGTLWGWHDNTPEPFQPPIELVLNGETISLTNGVVTRNNQAFVPLRSVFEKLGAKLDWDNSAKIVKLDGTNGASPLRITIDFRSGVTTLDGKTVQTQTEPFSLSGYSYLPLRFISEQLGANVEWKQKEEQISISYNP